MQRRRLDPRTTEYRPGIEFRIIVMLLLGAFVVGMLGLAWLGGFLF